MTERCLDRMTHPEVAAAATRRAVVVQPIGAVEQHGPHLPCGVDMMIAGALVDAAIARAPESLDVFRLPTLPYGKSNEHAGFAGTIFLSAETVYGMCRDIGRSVATSGFRKLAFVNGHGGQPQIIEVAARDIRAETGLQVFPVHAYRLPAMKQIATQDGVWGLHAGELETSLMLAIDPQAVRVDRFEAGGSAVRERFDRATILSLEGDVPTAWITTDISANGVVGDPAHASGEAGRVILDRLAADLVTALAEMADFEFETGRES